MSYSIKIVDNDDGDVLIDINDALAIYGAIGLTEGGEKAIGCCNCNSIKLAGTLTAAQKVIEMGLDNNPEVEMLMQMAKFAKSLENLTDSDD